MSDEKTTAPADEDVQALPVTSERAPVLMGSAEFLRMIDEAAVHLEVALALAGVDDQFEVEVGRSEVPDPQDLRDDLWNADPEGSGRLIKFCDETGAQLPVYVACHDDGTLLCVVSHEDDYYGYAPVRTMDEIAELVDDVRMAIETELPRTTYH